MPRRPAGRRFPRRFAGKLFAAAPLAGALICPAVGVGQEEPPAAAERAPTGAEPTDAPNPLAAEPTAPAEYVSAAARLRRIGRPGLARRYLGSLLASNPSDEALLAARDALGPAVFFELAGDPRLRPEGLDLQRRVTEAFAARGADPVRLDAIVDALTAAPRERSAAEVALVGLSETAAPRLVERLIESVDPVTGRDDLREAISRVLGRIGPAAVPALRAVLRSPEATPEARSVVAAALGRTAADSGVNALLAPAFDADERPGVQLAARSALSSLAGGGSLRGLSDAAATRLAERSAELLSAPPADANAPAVDAPAAPPLYRYDGRENRLIPATLSPTAADAYEAAVLAADAAKIAPTRDDLRTRELTAALAYEAALAGRGAFLPRGEGTVQRAALAAGTDRLLKTLDDALDLGATGAAAAALQVLLEAPTPDLLRPVGSAGSPVVRALGSPAAEVRFLAALLAARANPDDRFADGPAVVDVLAGALADAPGGRAVVIDPNGARAAEMGGLLQRLGYRVDLATGARRGFERAVAGAGADLIAVQANVPDLPVGSLAANLRADARTRSVPLVLYGAERLERPLTRIADRAGEALFVPYPIAPETLERRLAPLRAAAAPLPDELKADQKRAAAFELARLARTDGRTFNLRGALAELTASVADPTVSADAAAALATIPDRAAQTALSDALTVIRPGADAEVAAADALTRSVRRFGSLLPADAADALRRRAADEADPRLREALLTLATALPGGVPGVPVRVTLPAG